MLWGGVAFYPSEVLPVAEGFAAIDYAITAREQYLGNSLIISIQYKLEELLKTFALSDGVLLV